MSDQKQGFDKQNAPKSTTGAEHKTSAWKRLMAKKWVFPAVYVAAAAIILTIVWGAYNASEKAQDPASTNVTSGEQVGESKNGVAANDAELMKWPVKDRDAVEVVLPYYDVTASADVRSKAMIEYGDTFIPNSGLGIASKNKESFDVLAAQSGKVTTVQKNPLVGTIVEINHGNGYVTVYQSLNEVKVKENEEVKQGAVIGTAGRNELEKAQGVHLHFEVRQASSGESLNPERFLGLQQTSGQTNATDADASKQDKPVDSKKDASTKE